ncbi:hypothetical protein FQN50_005248 [Emmonsiellopsis sp. PD_5]|nr:hypothetical protein FQN50_005248 [Emmonsiellopsis sp. PD_5]
MSLAPLNIRQALLGRFYGLILLLKTLGPVRGARQKAEIISDELQHTKLRRHFCNALAYVCAFDTGSDSVTAIALDAQPHETTVLVAANRGVSPEVVKFLKEVLKFLQCVATDPKLVDQAEMRRQLVYKVVNKSQPRIRHYHQQAVDMYKNFCAQVITSERKKYNDRDPRAAKLDQLDTFLRAQFHHSRTPNSAPACLTLVQNCHGARYSGILSQLDPFVAQGQPCQLKFQRLKELVDKLGKHITCCRRLLDAATLLPREFVFGFDVKTIAPSKEAPIPLPESKSSVDRIVGRMYSKPEQESVKTQLARHDPDLKRISSEIKEHRRAKTQTHAELLIINYIEEHGCHFPDSDDRYIGCSKPACYLCHLYIRHHPGGYSLPDTSKKLYTKWRVPDIYASDMEGRGKEKLKGTEKILDKMIQEIKTDFRNDINRPGPRAMHADSSADKTSTVWTGAEGGGGVGVNAGPGSGVSAATADNIERLLRSLSLNDSGYSQEADPTMHTPYPTASIPGPAAPIQQTPTRISSSNSSPNSSHTTVTTPSSSPLSGSSQESLHHHTVGQQQSSPRGKKNNRSRFRGRANRWNSVRRQQGG